MAKKVSPELKKRPPAKKPAAKKTAPVTYVELDKLHDLLNGQIAGQAGKLAEAETFLRAALVQVDALGRRVGELEQRVETLTANIGLHTKAMADVAEHVRDAPSLPPVQAGPVPTLDAADQEPTDVEQPHDHGGEG